MTFEMKNIEAAFTITTLGVALGNFNDFAGNNAKIAALKAEIESTGALQKLLDMGDGRLMQVNSANTNGQPYRGFGVRGDFDVENSEKITVLAKEHAVFKEIVSSVETGADELTGKVFGGLIGELAAGGYKYVGPYNFTEVIVREDGAIEAEIWLPVEKA